MENYKERRSLLLKYLYIYLGKDLWIKNIINAMVNQLKNGEKITLKQFNAIMKFIERERPFVGMTREEVKKYFIPIIGQTRKKEVSDAINLFEL